MATSRPTYLIPVIDDWFWTAPGPRTVLPDDLAGLASGLARALRVAGPEDGVVFASSGSTGLPKLTVLRREALLASARLVGGWLGLGRDDRQLGVIPLHHVGGIGMVARSRVSGAALALDLGRWDAERFARRCEADAITVVSLVPTQVFDLVRRSFKAPRCLRAVVVGGGALDSELESEARHLGWPVLASFGMTETASMVATERPGLRAPGAGWLPVIDGWEARADEGGALQVRGPSLFSGHLVAGEGNTWRFEPAPLAGDGWWVTADLAEVRADAAGQVWLLPLGRTDDQVKIRGELVSLATAQRELEGLARGLGLDPRRLAVIDLPDERTGARLVLAAESDLAADLDRLAAQFNRRAPAYARLEGRALVDALPRSALGKLRRSELRRRVAGA